MFYALLVKNVIEMIMNIILIVYNANPDDDDYDEP